MVWTDAQKLQEIQKNLFTEASVTRITAHGKDGFIIVSTARGCIAPEKDDGKYDFESWQSLLPEFVDYCAENGLPMIEGKDKDFWKSLDTTEIGIRVNASNYSLDPESVKRYLEERNKACDTELYSYLKSRANVFSFIPTYGGYQGQTGELSDIEPSFIIFNNLNPAKDKFSGGWQELLARGLRMCEYYKQDAIYVQAPGKHPVYMDKDGKKLDWFEFGGMTYNRRGAYYTSSKRKLDGPKTFTALNLKEMMAFRNRSPKGLLDAMRQATTGELWRGLEDPESLEALPTVKIK